MIKASRLRPIAHAIAKAKWKATKDVTNKKPTIPLDMTGK